MKSVRKLALLAASVAAIGCGGQVLAQDQITSPTSRAHAPSDLPVDPAVRFGRLPNGMRYALRRNAAPVGEASLLLRIDAGSLVERDDQRGLAHFIEHLAFKGTQNLPGNMLAELLERQGLGAIRARTAFNETIYSLDLPRSDDASLDTALYVMREQVSEATLTEAAIDEERGVVQAEQRNNDIPYVRGETARLRLVAPRLGARMPIGDMDIIRTVSRERLVEFYNAYYRPADATLVLVGDFDLDATEAKLRRRFADWKPRGPAGPKADVGRAGRRRAQAKIEVTPGDDPLLSLIWVRPPDRSPDSRAARRQALLQDIGLAAFNRRLGYLSRPEAAPVERAGVRHDDEYGGADSTTLSTGYAPGELAGAITALAAEQRRLTAYGITDAELRQQISLLRKQAQGDAKAAATMSSDEYAEDIMRAVVGGRAVMSAQAGLSLFEDMVKDVTVAQVTRAMQPLFTGEGPLVTISTPTPIPGGEVAVLAQLKAAGRQPVTPPVQQVEVTWPYTDFGKAGVVASRRVVAGIDATVVTFANGTVLTVKPTRFADGEILVEAMAGLGELGMSADRIDPLFGANAYLTAGGLGKLTTGQLDQLLEGRTVTYTAAVEADRFRWAGRTRKEDLALQMQLLTAFISDPGLRPGPLERLKAGYAAKIERAVSSPTGAFYFHTQALMAGGDKRAAAPTNEEVQGLDMAIAGPRLRDAIGRGPIHVLMVGDLTVDQAIAATASTFGALPPRGPAPVPAPGADRRRAPVGGGDIVQLRHTGSADKALAFISWPGPDRIEDEREYRRVQSLAAILQLRVTDAVRGQGLSYVPIAGLNGSNVYRGPSQIIATADLAPDKTPAFYAAIDGIVRDLQAGKVTPDELARARGSSTGGRGGEEARNDQWLNILRDTVARPVPVEKVSTGAPAVEAMTVADIQALARKYLTPQTAWRATVTAASLTVPNPSAGGAR